MTRSLVGALAVGTVVLFWWLATTGLGSEDRWISPVILPSPAEVIRSFPTLLKERALLQSIPGMRLVELTEADWCCGSAGDRKSVV